MFDIYYKKNNNTSLFKYLEKHDFSNIQNYNPLYKDFFSLDQHNYNNINLNHRYSIKNIDKKINANEYNIKVMDDKTKTLQKFSSFFKFSPLMDPVKYMVGKYKHLEKDKLCCLPNVSLNNCTKKILDKNNSAYIDSFFSYLSSKLLNNHNFTHGFNFFGSFLAIQKEFNLNICDDIDYLYDSDFFHKNNSILFEVDEIDEDKILYSDTRNYRKKIKFSSNNNLELECETIDNNLFEGLFQELTLQNMDIHNNQLKEEYNAVSSKKTKSAKKTNSTCSSRSSNTSKSCSENSDLLSDSISNSQISDYSSMNSDDVINAKIKNFPIQIICLEKLENTLDSLIDDEDNTITIKQWKSCLFQIIMILITYQKVFNFTHNDLHTNNIMYVTTDKKFINYKFNNVYYRVPTYGKIFKIIDFGRAIYSFNGHVMCSDSYHPKGDAATQYNFEPYFNEEKPRLEANKSFDLCRLACSLFDYFIDDIANQNKVKHPIAQLIIEWTKDDKGRNILYKNNGEERYPEFKLYKMIVRTVHNHLPQSQLKNTLFQEYISSKRKIKKQKIINIDNMNSMC